MTRLIRWVLVFVAGFTGATAMGQNDHMAWWREARFGMFIHWGLYAIPAGEWGDRTDHGEWIRTTAQIPLEQYDEFRKSFNPARFDAAAWVKAAKAAGMKYIVITSKHHDGFCLFDSALTDHDVMDTPFKRDILAELAAACRAEGIRLCFYYSIMDWHHPDYLPRREWERDRPREGASFDRYVEYMKGQLRELLTKYGDIGVLWFDGQWEGTWNNELGKDLDAHVRSLQPQIIINSRVGRGGGSYGIEEGRLGDYATPEQFIPEKSPGFDWETCMTMNAHWGYNKNDLNYKSAGDLVRMLADIASKDGNFLLNVGPTAEGTFPPEALERMETIGRWLDANGEAIYGTRGSDIGPLPWGRITQRDFTDGNTRYYVHVFDWPANGRLVIPGLLNPVPSAKFLASGANARAARNGADVWLLVPRDMPDPLGTVIVLDLRGRPDIARAPVIGADAEIFIDSLPIRISSAQKNIILRYTTDGTDPGSASMTVGGPFKIYQSREIRAAAFRGKERVSPIATATFTKVEPRPAIQTFAPPADGLEYAYFEGDWNQLPDFTALTPTTTGKAAAPTATITERDEHFGLRFAGYLEVPKDGAYTITLESDDGSRMTLGGDVLIDNDGLHSLLAKRATVALAQGLHPISIEFFEKSGGDELNVYWEGPDIARQKIPASAWKHGGK